MTVKELCKCTSGATQPCPNGRGGYAVRPRGGPEVFYKFRRTRGAQSAPSGARLDHRPTAQTGLSSRDLVSGLLLPSSRLASQLLARSARKAAFASPSEVFCIAA
eukprot:SAG31_NODE_124_length_23684_cov_7.200127_12_plen_105_part_00